MICTPARSTVYVVDDDPEISELLSDILATVSIDSERYANGAEFLNRRCAHDSPPLDGCLILDMLMAEINGLEVMEKLAAMRIKIPIIMISGHGDIGSAVQAMRLGAIDFIQKPFTPQAIIQRVNEALRVNAEYRQDELQNAEIASRCKTLTPREREIFKDFTGGYTAKEIANKHHISHKTVESHRMNIARKMNAFSSNQLIVMGIQAIEML